MSNLLSSLTGIQLRRAAELKDKIDTLTAQLNSILGAPVSPAGPRGRRGANGRTGGPATPKKISTENTPTKRRKMSAAARAKISAAAKARWAKVRAAGKKSL